MRGKCFLFFILRKILSHEAPLLCLVFISKISVSLFSDNIHTSKPLSNIKMGKVVSLAEAAKGSFVFQQGKPCPCQARQHRLMSNCLSCGKIVCEQEGEGPCSFCGALVLKEGSTYDGLEESTAPTSDAKFAAEAYAKRLVEYDRNSAARTTVIDDQSDYYEIEGNNWLSNEVFKLLQYATYWLHSLCCICLQGVELSPLSFTFLSFFFKNSLYRRSNS